MSDSEYIIQFYTDLNRTPRVINTPVTTAHEHEARATYAVIKAAADSLDPKSVFESFGVSSLVVGFFLRASAASLDRIVHDPSYKVEVVEWTDLRMLTASSAPQVRNRHHGHVPHGSVYVGRPSIWGNPFSHVKLDTISPEFQVATREEAIARYEEWLLNQPNLMARLHFLRGKDLVCSCHPLPCHAEVLLKLANVY